MNNTHLKIYKTICIHSFHSGNAPGQLTKEKKRAFFMQQLPELQYKSQYKSQSQSFLYTRIGI